MRTANIFYKEILAGILTENDEGYIFQYDKEYPKGSALFEFQYGNREHKIPLIENKELTENIKKPI